MVRRDAGVRTPSKRPIPLTLRGTLQTMQEPLPPGEPIPPGFGPTTPPWVWKITYGLLGLVIGTLIVGGAVIFTEKHIEAKHREEQCWDPPPRARAWAYPKVISTGTPRPMVCARRADNNKGVFPHSHRCLRMVPCEDK